MKRMGGIHEIARTHRGCLRRSRCELRVSIACADRSRLLPRYSVRDKAMMKYFVLGAAVLVAAGTASAAVESDDFGFPIERSLSVPKSADSDDLGFPIEGQRSLGELVRVESDDYGFPIES